MKRMIKTHSDPTEGDFYIVKIWYEVAPSYDAPNGSQAAEEIIETVATSPQQALDQAKRAWDGPIDRIEIIDINPDEYVDEVPFGGSSVVASSKFDNSPAREASELIRFLNREGVDEHTMIEFFYDITPADEMIRLLKQLAEECDIDLDDFYN